MRVTGVSLYNYYYTQNYNNVNIFYKNFFIDISAIKIIIIIERERKKMERDIRKYEWTVTYKEALDFTSILRLIIDYGLDIDYSIACEMNEKMLHNYEKQRDMKNAIGEKIHEDVVKELTKRGYKIYNNKIVK